MKHVIGIVFSIILFVQSSITGYATEAKYDDSGTIITNGVYSIYTELDHSKVLGISNTLDENNAILDVMDYQGEDNQKFEICLLDDGCYSITSIYSGLSLVYEGDNIYQTDSTEENQKWKIKKDNNGSCNIYTSDEKKCIAVSQSDDGCNIKLEEISEDISQKFILNIQDEQIQQTEEIVADNFINEDFQKTLEISNIEEKVKFTTKTTFLKDGIYTIRTKLNLSKAIDIHGVSLEVGANVELYECNGGLNQKFIKMDKLQQILEMLFMFYTKKLPLFKEYYKKQ